MSIFGGYKVGVLMSVYHREDPVLFKQAMLSVLNQEFSRPVTVRVYLGVDGPVPAALAQAIQGLTPRMYKVCWHLENRGLACVLNDLIASREDEDFFFRMDTDDFSVPHRFDRQILYMLEHPDVDILGTDIVEIESRLGVRKVVSFAECSDRVRHTIAWRTPVAHPTVCFRSGVFDRVPGYPKVSLNEDIAMWFDCLRAGMRFDNLHEPLYEFRIDEGFWKRRGVKKAWAECKTYMAGLWALEGLTWRYLFPIARFVFRLLPTAVQRSLYETSLRKTRRLAENMDSAPSLGSI